ncbi:hypothetical protein CK203_024873 [Vitis vinifera]|uniref:DUF4283 domain-containing protein n=1 Tax=Vitis vinifera TaxID=29760 RepID=A0A438ITE8_VITVI|nr:hypothetical protein CK203_024873 [Vitis vinifera]
MAEKLKQVLGFLVKIRKNTRERLWRKLRWRVVCNDGEKVDDGWREGSGGEDDIEKWGKFWAKSWDLKGNLGLAKLNKRKALLEFEDLEEARRVVSSGAARGKEPREARPNVLEIEGEDESYVVSLWWECWPVLRRKCRDEADRQSREVRGEEDPRAGQRVMKGWGSGRLEMLHPSDDGTLLQGGGSGRMETSPVPSPSNCNWVPTDEIKTSSPIAGPRQTRRRAGLTFCLHNKKGSKALAVQEVTDPAHSQFPEAEFFAAREDENKRKLQGGVRLTETDRALKEESMRYEKGGDGRAGVIEDAQIVRSEMEGNWEESDLGKIQQVSGLPYGGIGEGNLEFFDKDQEKKGENT